jgi:hypothetical protein
VVDAEILRILAMCSFDTQQAAREVLAMASPLFKGLLTGVQSENISELKVGPYQQVWPAWWSS